MANELPHWTPWIEAAAAWALTYLLHSSLLLGLALAIGRMLPNRFLPVKEIAWRTALVGGLLTATLQLGLAVAPLGGSWRMELAAPARVASPVAVDRTLVDPAPAGASQSRIASGPAIAGAEGRRSALARPRVGSFVLAWLTVAATLLALLGISYLRLARRLGSRRPLSHGALPAILTRLVARAGARPAELASSHRIAVPLARGIRRREICLPDRLVTEMPESRQEIVLAHELAHLERRDPLWLLILRIVESLFFFQPLNRLARHHLQEIAEYRCDDWAVAATGRPVTMARCLTDVAGWSLERRLPGLVPTMAVDRSRLGRRVSRLLARDYPAPDADPPRWLGAAALALVSAMVLIAPGVSRATAGDSGDRQIVVLSEEMSTGEPQETVTPPTAVVPEPPVPPSPAVAPAAVVPDPRSEPEIERAMEMARTELESEMEAIQIDLDLKLGEIEVQLEPLELELETLVEQVSIQLEGLEALEIPVDDIELPDAATMARIQEISRKIAEAYQPSQEEIQRLTEIALELQGQAMKHAERAVEEAMREVEATLSTAFEAREAASRERERADEARQRAERERERAEQEIDESPEGI